MDQFNHKELNNLEARKKNQIKIPNRFVAFEDLDYSTDINRTSENIVSKSRLKCSSVWKKAA
jgi:hypothetical protein